MRRCRSPKTTDMIEAITSDRADAPLRISILPRRAWRDRSIPDAHGPHALNEPGAADAIPMTDDVSRRISPANALVSCCAIHSAVERAVTPNHGNSLRLLDVVLQAKPAWVQLTDSAVPLSSSQLETVSESRAV